MPARRLLLTFLALMALALAWNAVWHLGVLRAVHESVRSLHRPDLDSKLWLSLVQTAGVVALFLAGFLRLAAPRSVRGAAAYGAGFALLAGFLVDVNQYVLYPIPAKAAALWFLGGLVEFTLYGVLAWKLLRAFSPPAAGRSCGRPAARPRRYGRSAGPGAASGWWRG